MSENLDQKIESLIEPFSSFITNLIFTSFSIQNNQVPLVVIWLVIASLFFNFYFRFINIRAFKQGWLVAIGKFDKPDAPGEITHFQSFTAAMSGTIGLGNIAGVAVAISIGGPGAIFWMWVSGIIGMSTKFFTSALAVMYRGVDSAGKKQGGPMYFIVNGLGKKWFPMIIPRSSTEYLRPWGPIRSFTTKSGGQTTSHDLP